MCVMSLYFVRSRLFFAFCFFGRDIAKKKENSTRRVARGREEKYGPVVWKPHQVGLILVRTGLRKYPRVRECVRKRPYEEEEVK